MVTVHMIVNPSFYRGEVESQCAALSDRLQKRGAVTKVLFSDDFLWGFRNGGTFVKEKADLTVFFNKDHLLAAMLEENGELLLDSARSIRLCDDKCLTYCALSGEGIPFPETLPAPLLYLGTDGEGFLKRVAEELGFPVVAKCRSGSMGKQVRLAENERELRAVAEEFGTTPHMYQKFFGKRGEDIRVIVIGGRALCAMKRKNGSDFRSNVALGGKGFPHELTEKEREIAEKCAKTLGLDYCGVDLLSDENGNVSVCEVNSNAFFRGASEACKTDVAEALAGHILYKIIKNR